MTLEEENTRLKNIVDAQCTIINNYREMALSFNRVEKTLEDELENLHAKTEQKEMFDEWQKEISHDLKLKIKNSFGTQQVLADILGVSQAVISRWIRVLNFPDDRAKAIEKLSDGKITLDDMGFDFPFTKKKLTFIK
jgi:DNA-binding transcriptional regulator YdaS (Cro superfamily)